MCIEMRNEEFGARGGALFSNITIVAASTLNPLLVIRYTKYLRMKTQKLQEPNTKEYKF